MDVLKSEQESEDQEEENFNQEEDEYRLKVAGINKSMFEFSVA